MDQSAQDEIDRLKKALQEKSALFDQQSNMINRQNEIMQNLMEDKKNQDRIIGKLKGFQTRVRRHLLVRLLGLFKDEK